MNVTSWNSYYNSKEKNSLLETITRTISLWVAMGLLWLSFFSITKSWLQPCEVHWWVIIPWLFFLWVIYEVVFPRLTKHKWIRVVFPWVNCMVIIASLVIRVVKHSAGLNYIVGSFFHRFNYFYFTNFSVDLTKGSNQVAPVLTGLAMVLWIMFLELSAITKKRGWLGGFAVVPFTLALVLGLAPGRLGVLCLFEAMILLFTADIKGIFYRIAIPIALVMSLLVTNLGFDKRIEKLLELSDELIAWERSLNFANWDLSNLGSDFRADSALLDNGVPQQNGRDIFYVYSKNAPKTSMYFRGFYATNYENGSWTINDNAFEEACKQAGYSQEEMSKLISGMTLALLEKAGVATAMDYRMSYMGGVGNVAYLPYNFAWETLGDSYTFSGDYQVSKKMFNKEVTFTGIREGDLLKDPSLYTKYVKNAKDRAIREWYNAVAAQYLQVPEGIDGISQAVENILQYISDDDTSSGEIYGDETLNNALISNSKRNEIVNVVRAYLDKELRYTMDLPELPEGMDAVEYALTISHKGYCMHYATAATLILRELGIPTRYVSGYVVLPGDFVYSESDGAYVALVEDYRAHAWIEVYYDYIGWVPVEVTASVSEGSGMGEFPTLEEIPDVPDHNQNPPTPPDNNQNNGENGEDNPDNPDTPDNPDKPDTPDNPDTPDTPDNPDTPDAPDDSDDPEDDPKDPEQTPGDDIPNTPGQGGSAGEGGTAPGGTKGWNKAVLWGAFGGTVGVLLLGIVVVFMVRREKQQKQLIETTVLQGDGRKAVRRMNRRIYHIIRWKYFGNMNKIPISGYLTDAEYEALLKEAFPCVSPEDWERYMFIVKKMYYSKEFITEEEMQHCHRCYTNPQMKILSSKKTGK